MTETNSTIKLLIFFILLFLICYFCFINKSYNLDHFSPGVYDQMTAKGPLDTYLETGINKYIPQNYFPYYPYRNQLWNNPIRTRSYYWPIYAYPWQTLWSFTYPYNQ